MLKLNLKCKGKKGFSLIEIIISLSIISILLSAILFLKQYNTIQSNANDKYVEALNKFSMAIKYFDNNCSYETFNSFNRREVYYLDISLIDIDSIKSNTILKFVSKEPVNANKDSIQIVIEEGEILTANLTLNLPKLKGGTELNKKIFIGRYK